MLTPIVCFACGSSVGDKEQLFLTLRAARAKKVLAKKGIDTTMAGVSVRLNLEVGDILDKLEIKRDCCRTVMMTAMQFDDVY